MISQSCPCDRLISGFILLCSFAVSGCVPSPTPSLPPEQVTITIDPGKQAGSLDERYIGFSFDTAQLTGGYWWVAGVHETAEAETPDLESPKLRRLVSYLAPSLLRIGGTDCDGAYFCPNEGDCELPEQYQDVWIDKGEPRKATYFTHEDIRRAADFAEAVGARIMFCINVGPGPRDSQTGDWQPDNARELLRYIKSLPNGDLFDIWEPGNEVNGISWVFKTPTQLTPELFASDLATFRQLIDQEDPGGLVATPGAYYIPEIGDVGFTERLMPLARDHIDIATWHLYATQSSRCPQNDVASPYPASRENLFDESVVALHREHARYVREAASGLPMYNGESASAQCGGQQGVSDTLIDAMWQADWMGLMAEEGSSTVVRQTIVGGDYGIIDPETYDPRPTLLTLAMFRRTVEKARLSTVVDRAHIKAHGFCTAGLQGDVTAVVVNPTDHPLVAEIGLAGETITASTQVTLGANGDPTATRATLDGETTGPDGTIPEVAGTAVPIEDGKAYASVGPNTVVFVVSKPAHAAAACVGR